MLEPKTKVRKLDAFTCAAVNYLPKVRLLCQSLKQYHPEMRVHLALADEIPEWLDVSKEPFDDIISIKSLNIPNTSAWIFGHDVIELCTAIKPFVIRCLLDLQHCDQVYYFDPDIVLFSRLDELFTALDTSSVIVTPHLTKPETTIDAIRDNEICTMKHGIYNLGFIGVRNVEEGRQFAKWWSDRLYHFCQNQTDQGLFTDQRWIDFAPVFFEGVRLVKSPRFNVAPWNLSTRELTGSFEQGFTVDGEPLAFYHFTGFDSGAHKAMARTYAPDNTAVSDLIRWYEDANLGGTDDRIKNAKWAYGTFGNGRPVTTAHRLVYRMRKDLQEAFPNPFEANGANSYCSWFSQHTPTEHPGTARGGNGQGTKLDKSLMDVTTGDMEFAEGLPVTEDADSRALPSQVDPAVAAITAELNAKLDHFGNRLARIEGRMNRYMNLPPLRWLRSIRSAILRLPQPS